MRNTYFIAFNRYLIQKNTTKYSKSQQTTEAERDTFCILTVKLAGEKIRREQVGSVPTFLSVRANKFA